MPRFPISFGIQYNKFLVVIKPNHKHQCPVPEPKTKKKTKRNIGRSRKYETWKYINNKKWWKIYKCVTTFRWQNYQSKWIICLSMFFVFVFSFRLQLHFCVFLFIWFFVAECTTVKLYVCIFTSLKKKNEEKFFLRKPITIRSMYSHFRSI